MKKTRNIQPCRLINYSYPERIQNGIERDKSSAKKTGKCFIIRFLLPQFSFLYVMKDAVDRLINPIILSSVLRHFRKCFLQIMNLLLSQPEGSKFLKNYRIDNAG